jgi:AP2 domain
VLFSSFAEIDHTNLDKTDNRFENLRDATRSKDGANLRALRTNTSGAKGVCWDKRCGKWKASIQHDGKCYHLGYRDTREEAAALYAAAAEKYHGEFARTK